LQGPAVTRKDHGGFFSKNALDLELSKTVSGNTNRVSGYSHSSLNQVFQFPLFIPREELLTSILGSALNH